MPNLDDMMDLVGLAALEAYRPAYVPVVTVQEASAPQTDCPYLSPYCGEFDRCYECQIDHAYDEREDRKSDSDRFGIWE